VHHLFEVANTHRDEQPKSHLGGARLPIHKRLSIDAFSTITDFMTASAPSARLHWLLLDDREAREKEPSMMIIGCDFHPSFQQIAYVEQETGEYEERRLSHRGEAEAFYRSLAGKAVRIGVEATGKHRPPHFHNWIGGRMSGSF